MIFGFLIGIAGFLSMAYMGGFVETPEVDATGERQYATATERLEAFRCRNEETKMIIMGGIEDGFDPAGDESFEPDPDLVAHVSRFVDFETGPAKGEVIYTAKYDDPAQNRYFLDRFDIPPRTFRGMIATRLKDGSSVKNDGIGIGYGFEGNYMSSLNPTVYRGDISGLGTKGVWNTEDTYIWTDLDLLPLPRVKEKENGHGEFLGYSHESLLDVIRKKDGDKLKVVVVDDTMVDFIGFALCLEPDEDKGTVFGRKHYGGDATTHIMGDGIISLYSKAAPEGGKVSCQETRPLPCINDLNLPAPDVFTEHTAPLWSGGEIKFTEPVQGSRFKTEDDVDAYCAAQFGADFRVVNAKDGTWTGAIFGFGEYPEGHADFWVSYKDGPHHNCWELRKNYDDIIAEAQDAAFNE